MRLCKVETYLSVLLQQMVCGKCPFTKATATSPVQLDPLPGPGPSAPAPGGWPASRAPARWPGGHSSGRWGCRARCPSWHSAACRFPPGRVRMGCPPPGASAGTRPPRAGLRREGRDGQMRAGLTGQRWGRGAGEAGRARSHGAVASAHGLRLRLAGPEPKPPVTCV